jgi:hypothetical protein
VAVHGRQKTNRITRGNWHEREEEELTATIELTETLGLMVEGIKEGMASMASPRPHCRGLSHSLSSSPPSPCLHHVCRGPVLSMHQ